MIYIYTDIRETTYYYYYTRDALISKTVGYRRCRRRRRSEDCRVCTILLYIGAYTITYNNNNNNTYTVHHVKCTRVHKGTKRPRQSARYNDINIMRCSTRRYSRNTRNAHRRCNPPLRGREKTISILKTLRYMVCYCGTVRFTSPAGTCKLFKREARGKLTYNTYRRSTELDVNEPFTGIVESQQVFIHRISNSSAIILHKVSAW